jgi:hypothetical protein
MSFNPQGIPSAASCTAGSFYLSNVWFYRGSRSGNNILCFCLLALKNAALIYWFDILKENRCAAD